MQYEELQAELRKMLERIASEKGVTVVAVRGESIRRKFGVNGTVARKALRASGFWHSDFDLNWRAVAGAGFMNLESTEDGNNPVA